MAAKKASNGHIEVARDAPQKRFEGKKKAVSLTLTAEANWKLTELVNIRHGAATGVVASEAIILLWATLHLKSDIETMNAEGKLTPQIMEALEKQHAAISSAGKPVPQLSGRAGRAG